MLRGPIRLVASTVLAAWLGAAAAWAVRAGWADFWYRRETAAGLGQALRWTPERAAYWARLGSIVSDDDPARSIEAFEQAVNLNARDGNSWVELGLRSEARGDVSNAERYLLRAAEVDHGYLPRWSLANFYFRRNQPAKFWWWVRQAAAMVYGDPSSLFRLCWEFTSDGQQIEEQLGIGTPDLQASYLSYLLGRGRLEFAESAAARLLAWNREQDAPVLLAACNRFLEAQRAGQALEIWNRLAQANRIPFGALDPVSGRSLTDGSFAVPPVSQGFGWRLPAVEGISASRQESPPGVRLTFSGWQPQSSEDLTQFVPVREQVRYRLGFLYRTSRIAPGAGLTWRVVDANGGTVLGQTESLSSEKETRREFSFATPPGCNLVRLVLVYERSPGTARIEGAILVQEVDLDVDSGG